MSPISPLKLSVLTTLQQALEMGVKRHFRSAVTSGHGGSGDGGRMWFEIKVLGLKFKVTVEVR